MKRKWIFLSLITGLIMLAGVMMIDIYRSFNNKGGAIPSFKEEDAVAIQPAEIEIEDTTEDEPEKDHIVHEQETAKPVQAASARICVFGNVLLHENVLKNANMNGKGSGGREDYGKGFDFKPMFKGVIDLIEDADYAMINQASLVGANDSAAALTGYPKFNGPSSIADDYIALGFDGVNIASNHALDLGADGWINSVLSWKSKKINACGAYKNDSEAQSVEDKIIEVNGIKIAILSYVTDTNLHLIPDQDIGIPYAAVNGTALTKKKIESEIKSCREKADAVIVWICWACDASFEITDFQKDTATFLAQAGADVIIGHGPKALQRTEWIDAGDQKRTLCAYSLGNSLCTMQYIENLLGAELGFTLYKDEKGNVYVKDVIVEPTMIVYDKNVENLALVKISDFSEEDFNNHGSNILYGKGRFDWILETIKKQVDEPFLPGDYR